MHNRKLNELEYLNWLVGQPSNISMAITIKGNLQKELLYNALEKVQKKHPILETQLDIDEDGHPFLIWGNIGNIPIQIIPRTEKNQYKKIIEEEVRTPFKTGNQCSLPLIRVKVLFSSQKFDLIITILHVIADGMSMVFLFKDILDFIIEPEKKYQIQEVVKIAENVLPAYYQKKIPTTPRKFNRYFWFVKRIVKIYRFKKRLGKKNNVKINLEPMDYENKKFMTYNWNLTKQQSQMFIKKAKENNVTVHSALCTIFLSDFSRINNPVNLRSRLAYSVGDSVGCFAGGMVIKSKFKIGKSFWKNAKNYHKKLIKNVQSDKVFSFCKIFSRAVPIKAFNEFMPIVHELVSNNPTLMVTNLGSLDKFNILFASKNFRVENIYEGVTGALDALILAIYTVENKINFCLHYYRPPYTEEEIEKYVSNAKSLLNKVLSHRSSG